MIPMNVQNTLISITSPPISICKRVNPTNGEKLPFWLRKTISSTIGCSSIALIIVYIAHCITFDFKKGQIELSTIAV